MEIIIMKFNSWVEVAVIILGGIFTALCTFAFTAIFLAFV